VSIALRERNKPFDANVIDLQDKPPEFVSRYHSACADESMSAKVPMLETEDGTTLIESMVILEYLDDLDGRSSTIEDRARTRLFASLAASWLDWFGILRSAPGGDEEAAAVSKLREGLRAMDAFLSATTPDGPFLLGSEFSLAEAATAPFAQRLSIVLPGLRPELGGPQAWIDEDKLERLRAWMDAVCTRESCVESLPPPEELLTSYKRMLERMQQAAPQATATAK
jgi:glutathione S-transferase